MAYKEMKSENYANVGGINEKASTYKTGENEVLGLVNYDFSEPGAWTKRWGFTNTLSSGSTLTISSSQTLNDIWQIFKDGLYGTGNAYLDPKLSFLFGHNAGLFKSVGDVSSNGSTTFLYDTLITGYTNAVWDHVNYKEQTYFAANGIAYKYRPFTFPSPSNTDAVSYFGMAAAPQNIGGGLGPSGLTATAAGAGATLSGTYCYQYAYEDQLGFIGPRGSTFAVSTAGANTISIIGFTTGTAASFGYANYVMFRNRVPGFASTDMVKIAEFTGATFVDNGTFTIAPEYLEPVVSWSPVIDFNKPYSIATRFFEEFNNRLWTNAAFADPADGVPSSTRGSDYRLYWSEIDDFQTIFPESYLTITQSSFPLSGIKTFNQCLMAFCDKGIFRVTGDNEENFNLQPLTTEYGCISKKAIVEFKSRLWFLDEQGVVEFDGANIGLISNRMDDTFKSINLVAARQKAVALHVPERNEVWFAIPTGTADYNNVVVVFDYLANGWTTFSSAKLRPTALASCYREYGFESTTLTARIPRNKLYMFGSIGASLFNFHPSLQADDGGGMTLMFRTRNHTNLAKSSTSQFRRFYLDAMISTGTSLVYSQTFGLNFYANYASTAISYTTTINTSTLTENRIDFGIPAKALSVQAAYGSTTGVVKVYGYTIESRFQRSV